jgi:hypothetical protein
MFSRDQSGYSVVTETTKPGRAVVCGSPTLTGATRAVPLSTHACILELQRCGSAAVGEIVPAAGDRRATRIASGDRMVAQSSSGQSRSTGASTRTPGEELAVVRAYLELESPAI